MAFEDDDKNLESRSPAIEDLIILCKSLNKKKAKYIVVGGMAMINAGFSRATVDIDLLVDASDENIKKIKEALGYLPDNAISEINVSDVEDYTVVRVADEIMIDLMKSACGVTYEDAAGFIKKIKINGVEIPFPQNQLLLKMKQSLREKDKIDRLFLEELLNKDKF